MFFFFQAEDGIRDIGVTGVQTCALPISAGVRGAPPGQRPGDQGEDGDAEEQPPGGALLPVVGDREQQGAERPHQQIGRASCRERGEISVVAVSLKKKTKNTPYYCLLDTK